MPLPDSLVNSGPGINLAGLPGLPGLSRLTAAQIDAEPDVLYPG
jgi:hypothetical protein